jgi:hypothetical protein
MCVGTTLASVGHNISIVSDVELKRSYAHSECPNSAVCRANGNVTRWGDLERSPERVGVWERGVNRV